MKKSLGILLMMVFALLMGTTGAFAAETAPNAEIQRALVEVEETNSKIYHEIEKAVEKSYGLYEKYQEDLAKHADPHKQEKITAKYEEKVTKLISKLDEKTQEMTREGIEKAEQAGIVVEIEWIPVQFADRIALIDPIRVIAF